MESDEATRAGTTDSEETRRRLASEVAEIESAMALVDSGSASRITLTGLRFGEELARRFRADATSKGLLLEPILWPEDAGCDLIVRRIDE
ncbi:MAG: hypothetical protein ABSE58_06440 [Candidatus Limnocylindrales bacterium]|jgi:hypothetical protein